MVKFRDNLKGFLALIKGEIDLQNIYDSSMSKIRAKNPMPAVSSSGADLYDNYTAVLFAYGLPYRPRPIIQSFSAYTPKLAQINRDHLLSKKAAETILFTIHSIDERLPSSEDGLSWPELLTRYDITDLRGSLLLLKRLTSTRDYSLIPGKKETVKMGEWVKIPEESGPLWMQLNIAPTKIGELATLLFKQAPLYMEIETVNGGIEIYRVIPNLLSSGQLLSPLIRNKDDFSFLAHPQWSHLLKSNFVTKIRLMTIDKARFAYAESYSITLSRLEFPRQDFSTVQGWANPYETNFNLFNPDNRVNYQSTSLKMLKVDDQYIIEAKAPTRLEANIPQDSKKLSLGYGMTAPKKLKRIKHPLKEADGVIFRVLAVNADGEEKILLSELLNPINNNDLGVKKAEINLSDIKPKKIILEILPGKNTYWDFPYWSEARLE